MALRVLYEDDSLLAVDKPAGIVVHPSYKNKAGTLLDALNAADWPAGERPSIVGRLDKPTSGIVIVAKRAAAHAALQRALASPDAEKTYLAIVRGVPPERGTIDLPLAPDPSDRRRRAVSDAGRSCLTEFVRLGVGTAFGAPASLLECRLRTGRRHQIRAHLAARGWPILGDATYGEPLDGFPRVALHASRVAFRHPVGGAWIVIASPAPPELHDLIVSGRYRSL